MFHRRVEIEEQVVLMSKPVDLAKWLSARCIKHPPVWESQDHQSLIAGRRDFMDESLHRPKGQSPIETVRTIRSARLSLGRYQHDRDNHTYKFNRPAPGLRHSEAGRHLLRAGPARDLNVETTKHGGNESRDDRRDQAGIDP